MNITSFQAEIHQIVAPIYLAVAALAGLVVFAAGYTVAKMSDEDRDRAMPESLVTLGRAGKEYWESQAMLGALFAACAIFAIALILVGEI